MPRRNLLQYFARIATLSSEIDGFVPPGSAKTVQFRADLAGLLVVMIAATYESCVKESLNVFAAKNNRVFGDYTFRSYSKLNSRIQISDLNRYLKLFDSSAPGVFKAEMQKQKDIYDRKLGRNIEKSYEQILSWRHDFAHSGVRNTTVEEAVASHNAAKHVLYCFEVALNGP